MDKSLVNTIYSLYIINKAGGLIYQKVPAPPRTAPQLPIPSPEPTL